jgi:hypothetical protein
MTFDFFFLFFGLFQGVQWMFEGAEGRMCFNFLLLLYLYWKVPYSFFVISNFHIKLIFICPRKTKTRQKRFGACMVAVSSPTTKKR